MSTLASVIQRGLRSAQPAATTVPVGTLYFVTDENVTERSSGSAWQSYSGTVSGTVSTTGSPASGNLTKFSGAASITNTDLTGDVTTSGGVATTIANDAVSYAKMQNVSAASKILGRGSASGAGDPQEITLGANLSMSGTTLAVSGTKYTVGITVDGAGSVITTGVKGYRSIPVTGTIVSARVLASQSGSIVFDIWKDTYANYPPTVADTITASAKPTLSSATKAEDTTLTGWTTAVTAGDVLGFNVDSVTTITRATLELIIQV
jgi:hypothetical protein